VLKKELPKEAIEELQKPMGQFASLSPAEVAASHCQ